MTQSQSAAKTATTCAGELLWAVSLLPVQRPAPAATATGAIVIDLPIQEAIRRRNAA